MRWLILPIAFIAPLSALVEGEIDEKHPLAVRLSTSSHNRISIESGGVEKVFGDGSLFSVSLDPSTGNAFVNLLKETEEKPATLTVVTNSGRVQDLLVLSDEGPSEQIHLKETEEDDSFSCGQGSHGPTVDLLNQILQGKIPFGYGQRELQNSDDLTLPAPLSSQTLKVFEGPFEIISIYRLENLDAEPIVIAPEAFKKEEGSWAFLNAHELGQNERALCIVGRPKDGL